ncbi:MAG: hypothetical protein WA151_02230 [Desulfatirhabdiaceae bacterium]
MSDDLKILGPKPEKVTIGIREYEDLEIWPLSMADQLEIGSVIDAAIATIIEEASDTITLVMSVRKIIENNLHTILQMVSDFDTEPKAKKALKKITNDQFVQICEKIYQMNFERISKNVKSFLGEVNLLATGKPLPTLSSDIQDTESSTSPLSASEPEA